MAVQIFSENVILHEGKFHCFSMVDSHAYFICKLKNDINFSTNMINEHERYGKQSHNNVQAG